jgi:hypothetical protein
MSLNNPLKHQTHKPKKETPVQYDLLKDNFGIDKGKPDCDWDWSSWHPVYGHNVFTEGKQDKEVFEFFNEEINYDCNVPEPTSISFILMASVTALVIKKRFL